MEAITMSAPEGTAVPLVTVTLDTPVDGWRYDEDGEPFGGRTIGEAIVAQAAERLVAKLRDDVRKAVIDEFKSQIVAQVAAEVTDVIATPVQLTNSWGEPTGETTSVREHIAKEVAKQLSSGHSSDYRSDRPVLRKVIEDEVIGVLNKELRGAVEVARNKVVSSVKTHAAELIAKAVKDGLR